MLFAVLWLAAIFCCSYGFSPFGGQVVSTDPTHELLEIAQGCVSVAPVIILGSGASAAHGIPGMPQLRSRLLTAGPPSGPPNLTASWSEFIAKLETSDLESALTEIKLPDVITRYIVETTWDYLAPFDLQVLGSVVKNRNVLPLTRLFRHIFASTHNEINVITPNYDRLAEYAADAGELHHFTGFSHGHIRHRAREPYPKLRVGRADARTVNIWKVHGSFDWFSDQDDIVMGLPISGQRPSGVTPVIVTPGIEKYRLTHGEPFRSIQQGADSALQAAKGFLCIGYGFNDPHVQTKLVERCRTEQTPLVLVTKEISPAALEFLKGGKCQKYLAVEEHSSGCKVYSPHHPDGVVVAGKSYWRLDEFLSAVT